MEIMKQTDEIRVDTEEEAKEEFKTRLENFLENQIDYYRELVDSLDNLK